MTSPIIHDYDPAQDEAIVSASWKQSSRSLSPALSGWCGDGSDGARAYFGWANRYVPRVIASSSVRVACNPSDRSHVWGWICFEPGVLHYVWVRNRYRRHGIAKGLVVDASTVGPITFGDELTVTHWTRAAEKLQGSYLLHYRPGLILDKMR